jgi:hypothetical protein
LERRRGMSNQNKTFEYNLPLQAYRGEDGKINVLNYMPRKNSVQEISLDDLNENEISEEDFLYGTAANLLNLAILFCEFADKKRDAVYYHDEDIEIHFPPLTYRNMMDMSSSLKEWSIKNKRADS